MVDSTSNSAFELLKEELENDDIQIKVNAVHRLPIVIALYTQDKIISDLIPAILKLMANEEDEVLLAFSEQLPKFRNFLDSSQITNVLPLFQFLLGVEETVVREQAVEGMRELIKTLTEDQVQKDVITLLNTISAQEYFTWKVSACYLIRMCYEKAGKEKEKLRALYFKLCDDETPLIKRTAAKEFGPLCLVIEKEIVSSDMITYYKKFMTESDSVRVTILPSVIQLVKVFQNTDLQRLNIQFVVAASEDKSWRVRHELAIIFPMLIEGFASQINELVPTLANLIKDPETEVRLAALEGVTTVIRSVNSEKVSICIIPALLSLNNESSPAVKALIGEALGPIARSVGYTVFNNKLSGTMDTLMKDEKPEVRLGVAKSLFDIFISSEGSLLGSISTILGGLQKDTQYRIREQVFDTLGKLGVAYGLDVFKSYIETLFFNYMTDIVASVREVGIKCLELLIAKFGSSWTIVSLIPKFQNVLSQPKVSYLHRMCVLNSLAVCSKYLNSTQINEGIIPPLVKSLKDKVPNVKFFTIKLFELILPFIDSVTKEKIKQAIKDLTSDEDIDVKFFASKFITTY